MIVAAAQTIPKKEDIAGNLHDHYRLIEQAADHGAQLIAFPELSITGYERALAPALSFIPNDARLDPLRTLAVEKNMSIIAGAPIKMESGLAIGSFIMNPNGSLTMYTKQFLHEGEEEFFTGSLEHNPQISLEGETISFAICADIVHPSHPKNAGISGSTLYIASLFYTPNGIGEAHATLSRYAETYLMNVLMSNYGGPSWGLESGGQSAFWTKDGALIAQCKAAGEGLLLVKKEGNSWTGKSIETNYA